MALPTHILEIGARTIDLVRGDVSSPKGVIRLTSTELKLLSYLASRAGQVVSRDELYRNVWGYHERVRSRALDATMARLRAKIELEPSTPRFLLTVQGQGYQLSPQCAPPPLELCGSRVVLPEWRSGVTELVAKARSLLGGGDGVELTSIGVMALRTLARVGPRDEGLRLSDELLSASLTPSHRAWVLAETLPLLKGAEYSARADEALGLAEAIGEPALLAVVLMMCARGYARPERLTRALHFAEQSGSSRLQMRALSQLATTLPADQIAETQALYLRAFEMADLGANEWEAAVLDANYARFLLRVGEVDEGVRRLEAALAVFVAWEDRPNTVMSYLNLGVVECRRLRFVEARRHYVLGQAEADRLGERGLWVLCRLGELGCGEQLLGADIGELEALLKECRRAEYHLEESVTLMLLGLAWRARGQLELARPLMEKSIAVAHQAGDAAIEARYTGDLGSLLVEAGEVERGTELLRSSIRSLLDHRDQDAALSKHLLCWHRLGRRDEPEFEARLRELAGRLPAPAGTPWEGLAELSE